MIQGFCLTSMMPIMVISSIIVDLVVSMAYSVLFIYRRTLEFFAHLLIMARQCFRLRFLASC